MAHVVKQSWYFGPFDVPVENIHAPDKNIKSKKLLKDVEKSILYHGLLNPLDLEWRLNEDFDKLFIIRGNHRLQAVKNLRWNTVRAYIRVVDCALTFPIGQGLKLFLPFVRHQMGENARTTAVSQKLWQSGQKT